MKQARWSHALCGVLLGLIAAPSLAAQDLAASAPNEAHVCQMARLSVQVLGSGGPEFDAHRASTGYVVWREGKAWALVDAGSGTRLRFAQTGAKFEDLKHVLFTHVHVDHSVDFAGFVKSSYFTTRTQALQVWGPTGNAQFPATRDFVQRLFARPDGVYPYLGGYLSGQADYAIQAHDIDANEHEVRPVFEDQGLRASAVAVEHGVLPALAWRLDLGEHSVTFSGDTSGRNGWLASLARDTDLLIAHHAITWRHQGVYGLHMPPAVIGEVAQQAQAKRVWLSHRMQRTLGDEARTLSDIRETYAGPVRFAEDLQCRVVVP
jgi:ribonuclease BN (tRNA processing enzyme)